MISLDYTKSTRLSKDFRKIRGKYAQLRNECQEELGRFPKGVKSNHKQDCGRIYYAAEVHPTPSEL